MEELEELERLVVIRLGQVGYTVTDEDSSIITYYINKVCSYVKMFCHIQDIPELAYYKISDKVCSEFLLLKLNTGALDDYLLDQTVGKVELGDVSVSFDNRDGDKTPNKYLQTLITKLGENFEKGLVEFRRIAW